MSSIMKSFTVHEKTIGLLSEVSGPGKQFTNASAAARHAIEYAFENFVLDPDSLVLLSEICGPGKQFPNISTALNYAIKNTYGGN
jgi:hypothetical protein